MDTVLPQLWYLIVNGHAFAWGFQGVEACLSFAKTIVGANTLQCAAQLVLRA